MKRVFVRMKNESTGSWMYAVCAVKKCDGELATRNVF